MNFIRDWLFDAGYLWRRSDGIPDGCFRITGSTLGEQGTENREQRTGNREQRTENREQRTENREQRTENREQALALKGNRTGSFDPVRCK